MSQTMPNLAELYAPVQARLERVVAIMDDELQSDLPVVNKLCTHIKGYRGKMLRPALLLLTGEACGGLTDDHYTLAAVVELVHLASLVHDDVLDEAEIRRRQPTVNSLNGNETAVLLGDYFFTHAFHLCSGLDSQYASRLIGSVANKVCTGELLQIQHRGCYDISEHDYFEIIRRKTAALTGVACTLGAKFAGAAAQTVVAAGSFGVHGGMAFQIVDDVLDIVGTENAMGKTLGRDLDLGKVTLPLIHFLSQVDAGSREKVLAAGERGSHETRANIAAHLKNTGSIAYAMSVAESFVSKAIADLQHLPDSAARSSLIALTEFLLRRDT